MGSVNKVIIVGNLGSDPDLRDAGGTPVCNFSVATNEKFKNRAGEQQERTEWHRCVAWSKLAEICAEYLRKGRQVYIEGKLQTRKWEKDGDLKYTTEVIVNNMVMLGRPGDEQADVIDRAVKDNMETPAPADDDDLDSLPF